jgi:L-ascorbate metabolism protein UlaG (beta-lactamase superfamily)
MSTRIRFLGCSCFEIVGPDRRIVIDPLFTDNPKAPISAEELETPDVILVTHAARDHYGDAASLARRTGAPVVCGHDVRLMLLADGVPEEQIRGTVWGVRVRVGGVVVLPLENHHFSLAGVNGSLVTGQPLSYIVETEPGVRIYHSGDTAFFDISAFGQLYQPTVALIGCSVPDEFKPWAPGAGEIVTGETSPDEAALMAEMLGVRVAVGHHYLEPDADAARFLEEVRRRDSSRHRHAITPRAGEVIVIDGSEVTIERSVS